MTGASSSRARHQRLLAQGGLYAQLHGAQNGAGRGRASAAVSADGLSELTTAIVESRRDGHGISGPALAELARAMSRRAGDSDDAWQLLSAAWPLLQRRLARAAARAGRSQRQRR